MFKGVVHICGETMGILPIMRLTAGTNVDDKYEIRSMVGYGGMGVVYEAYQQGLQRTVAIKQLTGVPSECPDEVRRFEREALILSRLLHINIVQFYAYGIWAGQPYIAMELLTGTSLHQLLSNGPLAVVDAVRIMQGISAALHHAHTHDVIHRDLKPSNVILCAASEGTLIPKVIDFGLARLPTFLGQKLTQTGETVGSVMYMSPEQCHGQKLDLRTDIYSCGCILYQLLTGVPPHEADNGFALMFEHINAPISSTEKWAEIAHPLQLIIAKCVAKNRQDRYSSAQALADDLQLVLNEQAPELEGKVVRSAEPGRNEKIPVAGSKKRRKHSALLIAGSVCAGAGFFGIYFHLRPPEHAISPGSTIVQDSPSETMTRLTRFSNQHSLTKESSEQLRVAINGCKNDPVTNQNMLVLAYTSLGNYFFQTNDVPKARSIAAEGLQVCCRADNNAEEDYFDLALMYHKACTETSVQCGPGSLQEALRRYPNAGPEAKARVQIPLAIYYLTSGKVEAAKKLLDTAMPHAMRANDIADGQAALRQVRQLTKKP